MSDFVMSDFKELSRSVKGLTVLVTGAASGMGRATALVFAAEGAKVAVTDINAEATQAVASEITAKGGTAKAWTLDVANRDAITQVVGDIAAHFGGLDIIVNNAGISVRVPIDDDGYEDAWARGLAVMLTAHPRIIRAALPHLRKSKSPRDRQYRFHRGARRYRIAQSLLRGESRRHWPDAIARGGTWARRYYGELHLPGPDPHGDHGADFGGAQDHLCQAPHRAWPLR
jgi:NAD(P)-dependent dehydrogenase (short-subunit alcohol dehydrogenase family)